MSMNAIYVAFLRTLFSINYSFENKSTNRIIFYAAKRVSLLEQYARINNVLRCEENKMSNYFDI